MAHHTEGMESAVNELNHGLPDQRVHGLTDRAANGAELDATTVELDLEVGAAR